MRIAHIITRLIVGGAQENTILNCQDLIDEYGDDVLLITGPGLGPEGSLEDDARRRGIPLHVIDAFRRSIHPWRDWRSYRKLRRILADWRPDVVHTHSGKAGLLGRMAAHALQIPAIVHTVHGAPFHAYQGRGAREFFKRCERFASARCHRIISVADAMTTRLVDAAVADEEKFVTIYSGMEVEPFLAAHIHRAKMRQQLGFAEEDIVVAKIARLFHLKGHADLVSAASHVADAPKLKYLLVGGGVLKDDLIQGITEAGLADRFQFTGLVAPTEIPALLGAVDVVVHLSYREGLARVLPQAMLCGKPVISYDIDGAGEVVTDGETGFLAEPDDTKTIAQRVVQLARDPQLRAKLGKEGRRRCRESFDHRQMTRQIRALYEQILSNPAIGS